MVSPPKNTSQSASPTQPFLLWLKALWAVRHRSISCLTGSSAFPAEGSSGSSSTSHTSVTLLEQPNEREPREQRIRSAVEFHYHPECCVV